MNEYQQFKSEMSQWTPETLNTVGALVKGILQGWPVHFLSDELIQEMRRRYKNAKRRKTREVQNNCIDLKPEEYSIIP